MVEVEDGAVAVVAKPTTKLVVKEFVEGSTLKRDLAYSTTDLGTAMMQQASLFAHYGVLAAQASKQVDTFKLLLETAEAMIYRKLRDEYVTAGEKVTEAQLEKAVARADRILNIKKALNEAKQVESVAKNAVEAFRHRRDMLVQQGLLEREEMKGDLRIAEKNARQEAMTLQQQGFLARRAEIRDGKE